MAAGSAVLILAAPHLDRLGGSALTKIAYVGEISYGLYLIHVPVGNWIVLRLADSFGWRNVGLLAHVACDITALGASLVCATAIYRWIE